MLKLLHAGAGERMQHLSHKYNDTTIRFILRYPGILNPDTLCAATRAVIDEVDILHASFVANSHNCHWRVNTKYQAADYFSLAQCEGNPMKAAESFALRAVEYKDKCQMQVTLVQGNDACAVVVRISHLVVDGSDGKYLLNKLAEGYRMLEDNGVPRKLEVKNGARSAMGVYNELGIRELSTLMKMPSGGTKTDYPFADAASHGPLRMLRCTIPADVLGQAGLKAKMAGATVNDLLLTACYCSYAKTTGREGAMSVTGMMDLRQHCKGGISEGLSNMSGSLSTTLEYVKGSTFSHNLVAIARQTSEKKSNPLAGLEGMPLIHTATKTVPMWILLQAAAVVYSNMSLSLTNLGNISCDRLIMGGLKPDEGVFGGPLKRKPSVQVCVASFDGTAELTVLGDFVSEDLEALQSFLDGMRKETELYLEEKAVTAPASMGAQAGRNRKGGI